MTHKFGLASLVLLLVVVASTIPANVFAQGPVRVQLKLLSAEVLNNNTWTESRWRTAPADTLITAVAGGADGEIFYPNSKSVYKLNVGDHVDLSSSMGVFVDVPAHQQTVYFLVTIIDKDQATWFYSDSVQVATHVGVALLDGALVKHALKSPMGFLRYIAFVYATDLGIKAIDKYLNKNDLMMEAPLVLERATCGNDFRACTGTFVIEQGSMRLTYELSTR